MEDTGLQIPFHDFATAAYKARRESRQRAGGHGHCLTFEPVNHYSHIRIAAKRAASNCIPVATASQIKVSLLADVQLRFALAGVPARHEPAFSWKDLAT